MKPCQLFLALIALLLFCPSLLAQLPQQPSALRDLPTLNVGVQELTEEAKHNGLNAEQIRTDVELRLRRIGIHVSPSDAKAFPRLFVRIDAQKIDQRSYLYQLSLELFTLVDTKFGRPCKPGIPKQDIVFGVIWFRGGYGMTDAEHFEKELRGRIGDMADRFVNDFLAENQKP